MKEEHNMEDKKPDVTARKDSDLFNFFSETYLVKYAQQIVIRVPKMRKLGVSFPESLRSSSPEIIASNPTAKIPTSAPRESATKTGEFTVVTLPELTRTDNREKITRIESLIFRQILV